MPLRITRTLKAALLPSCQDAKHGDSGSELSKLTVSAAARANRRCDAARVWAYSYRNATMGSTLVARLAGI